jgi:hypothetical protein
MTAEIVLPRPVPRSGDETYSFLWLSFNVTYALELYGAREAAARIKSNSTSGMTHIDVAYAMSEACDPTRPGLLATLPGANGRLLIDGNHRAFKAAALGQEMFPVIVLSEEESKHVCYTPDVWAKMEAR